jgi:hypothetical protein
MNQDDGETRDLTDAEKALGRAQLMAHLQKTNEVPISEDVKDMVDVGRVVLNRAQRRLTRRRR